MNKSLIGVQAQTKASTVTSRGEIAAREIERTTPIDVVTIFICPEYLSGGLLAYIGFRFR